MYPFVDYLTQETPSIERLSQRLKEHPDLLTATDSTGRTFLHWAVQLESVSKDIIQWAIDKGSVVKCQDKYDMTPLDIAAGKGNIEKVELLVKNGDDLKGRDRLNRSAFYRAILNDAPEVTLDYFIRQQAFLLAPITEKYESTVVDEDEVPAEESGAPLHRVKSNMESWFDLCDKHGGKFRLQVYFAAVSHGYTHVLEALVKKYPKFPTELKQFYTRTKLISVAVQHHQVELLRSHYKTVILGHDGLDTHLSLAIAELPDDVVTTNLVVLFHLLIQIADDDLSGAFSRLIKYLNEKEKSKILHFLCDEYLPKQPQITFNPQQICELLTFVTQKIKEDPAKEIFEILFVYFIQHHRQAWAQAMDEVRSMDFFAKDKDFFTALVKRHFKVFCKNADFDGALIMTKWANRDLFTNLFSTLLKHCQKYFFECNKNSVEVRTKIQIFMQNLKNSSKNYNDFGKFQVSAVEGVYLCSFGSFQEAFEQYQKILKDYNKFSKDDYYVGVSRNIAHLILNGYVEINDAYPEQDIATQPLLAITANNPIQQHIDARRQINNRILCKRASQAYPYVAKYKDHPSVKQLMTRIHWMLAGFAEVDESARTLPPLLPESLRRFTAYHLSFLPYPVADFIDEQLLALTKAHTETQFELVAVKKVMNEKDKWKQRFENQFSSDENQHLSDDNQDSNNASQTAIPSSPNP